MVYIVESGRRLTVVVEVILLDIGTFRSVRYYFVTIVGGEASFGEGSAMI